MARRKFRRALDLDVGVYSDLHARVVADWRRNELVAGDLHNFSRQSDCGDSDDPQRARRYALWNPLPGFLSRVVRHARREHPRANARVRGLRLVWNPNLDWRQ